MVQSLCDDFCKGKWLLTDRAYEGDANRNEASAKGFQVVVPPKKNRKEPWEYDKELYKRRNEIERNFRRNKEFRRVFTRYDKLDTTYAAFVHFACTCEVMRIVV